MEVLEEWQDQNKSSSNFKQLFIIMITIIINNYHYYCIISIMP